jgi:hypothetical protein
MIEIISFVYHYRTPKLISLSMLLRPLGCPSPSIQVLRRDYLRFLLRVLLPLFEFFSIHMSTSALQLFHPVYAGSKVN